MSDVKSEYAKLTLGGREYEIALTLGVIDALQDKYGSLSDALDRTSDVRDFRFILTAMLNDYIEYHNAERGTNWPLLSEAAVGRQITVRNITEVNEAMVRAFMVSIPHGEEDSSPNAQAG